MNWRAIMGAECMERTYEQNPQYPQNLPVQTSIGDFGDIVPKNVSPEAKGALTETLRAACHGLDITPKQFRSLLTEEDIEAIAAGHYPVPTLAAYAKCMAEDLEAGRLRVLSPQRNDV